MKRSEGPGLHEWLWLDMNIKWVTHVAIATIQQQKLGWLLVENIQLSYSAS